MGRNGSHSIGNLILFVTTYPCNLCAKMILETGIKEIVYLEPYPMESAKKKLDAGNVKQRGFTGFSPRTIYKSFFGPNLEKVPR